MKIAGNTRRILFNDLLGDQYHLKTIPQNSIGNMIDIGAGEGVVSLLARLLHPDMKIVSIEPHKETYDSLCDNLSRMKVKTLNAAFGDGGVFHLQKERKSSVCNAYLPNIPTENESTSIISVTLESIATNFKIDTSDLMIKMDCEGAEWCLIEDRESQDILKACKLFVLEIHGDKESRNVVEYFKWLTDLLWETHTVQFTRYSCTLGLIKAITRKELETRQTNSRNSNRLKEGSPPQ